MSVTTLRGEKSADSSHYVRVRYCAGILFIRGGYGEAVQMGMHYRLVSNNGGVYAMYIVRREAEQLLQRCRELHAHVALTHPFIVVLLQVHDRTRTLGYELFQCLHI